MQNQISKAKRVVAITGLVLAALLWSTTLGAGAKQSAMAAESKEQPFAIEYYYKAKWGMPKNSWRYLRRTITRF
jgi:hypothetical protein